MLLDEAPLELSGPRSAAEHGIAVVHQERNLVGAFSVAENLFLGNQPRSRGLVSYRRMFSDARPWLREVGLDVDPSTEARQLSPGQAQLLEIARALSARCRVLFLDEPTSSISETDSEHLFTILRELRDRGTAIVFVSHKLEEVYGLCDRVTVLRDGRNVITGRRLADISRADIVRAMVGRESQAPVTASRQRETGAARLKLESLATRVRARGREPDRPRGRGRRPLRARRRRADGARAQPGGTRSHHRRQLQHRRRAGACPEPL